MKRYTPYFLQLCVAVLIFSVSAFFVLKAPRSSAWLHREENLNAAYKIGRIDLWLNSLEETVTQIHIAANAPTRFFTQDAYRDENFDVAVTPYQIYGLNKGDIDLKTDLSVIDNNTGNNSLFYIFVPSDTEDADFLAGHYRDYLDTLFSGYSLTTTAECKAAMNEINQNALEEGKGKLILKDEEQPIFTLLVWSEYDNIVGVIGENYVSYTYPLTINAFSYQLYYETP